MQPKKNPKADLNQNRNLYFVIGLDHKTDDPLSVEYFNNLKSLESDTLKVVSVDNKLIDKPLTTVTATSNFFNLVESCETEWFMMWEHDWVFARPIDNEQLKLENTDIDMVRFNQHPNVDKDGEVLWVEDNKLFTNYYCNNPFVTSKTFWNEKVVPIAENIPDWWGEYGAFIEGPMKQYRDEQLQTEEGKREYLKNYRIALYGKMGDEPSVYHLDGQRWGG